MKRLLGSKTLLIIGAFYTALLIVGSLIKINAGASVKTGQIDKVFHFSAYFGLTVIWQLFFLVKSKQENMRPSLWICFFAIIFGIVIEILQDTLTTYRSFESWDIVANTGGVMLAYAILYLVNPKKILKSYFGQ